MASCGLSTNPQILALHEALVPREMVLIYLFDFLGIDRVPPDVSRVERTRHYLDLLVRVRNIPGDLEVLLDLLSLVPHIRFPGELAPPWFCLQFAFDALIFERNVVQRLKIVGFRIGSLHLNHLWAVAQVILQIDGRCRALIQNSQLLFQFVITDNLAHWGTLGMLSSALVCDHLQVDSVGSSVILLHA
jgi:hypothetical protein